jgi:hypothetical protein
MSSIHENCCSVRQSQKPSEGINDHFQPKVSEMIGRELDTIWLIVEILRVEQPYGRYITEWRDDDCATHNPSHFASEIFTLGNNDRNSCNDIHHNKSSLSLLITYKSIANGFLSFEVSMTLFPG